MKSIISLGYMKKVLLFIALVALLAGCGKDSSIIDQVWISAAN